MFLRVFMIALLFALAGAVEAQESTSFKLSEFSLNSGGHPEDGISMASTNFRISLDAIGQGVSGLAQLSGGFSLHAGFVPPYAPPGEVDALLFTAPTTLTWESASAASAYNVYRGDLATLAGSQQYGACSQTGLTTTTTTDAANPAAGSGFLYLVAAANAIAEEGSRGTDSAGSPRTNATACP